MTRCFGLHVTKWGASECERRERGFEICALDVKLEQSRRGIKRQAVP